LRKRSHEEATEVFPEVIERALRMVSEAASEYSSQWAAIESIAAKIGCTPETLRRWVRQQERNTGQRPGPTTAAEERIKALKRELRKANEILRLTSALFAQAKLDHRFKS
jgi:transposase